MSNQDRDSSDSSDDSDSGLFEGQQDVLSEHYLVLILRQLIDSGELHMVPRENTSLPVIKKKPNLDKLKVGTILSVLFCSFWIPRY
jgi:hypothetical protein